MSLIPSKGDSRGIALLVVTAVFVTLAACAVFLRVWARRIKKISLCFNDYSVIFALFLMSALIASFTIQVVSGGLGQHQKNVSLAMTEDLNKAFLAAEMIWALSNTSVKLSILHLYIMIFRIRTFRIITYVLMGTTIVYCSIVILEAFLICRPLAFFWNKTIEGSCGNEQAIFLSTGILNLMIDVMVVILPMPMLWGLQLRVAKKVALTGIFGLGAGICVITVLRITALKNLNFADFTYAIEPVAIWSVLEPTLGIISACLPVIQPVLQKLSNSPAFAWTRKTNSDRTGKNMRYGEGDSKNFQRLNDNTFPLSETGGTKTHITGADSKLSPNSDDLEAQAYFVDPPRAEINVRRDYEVESKAYTP